MKKIISLVLVVVMVLGCISLIACGGGGGGGATTPPGGGTTPPGEEETTPPGEEETTPPEETLVDILGRLEGLEAVKYDMVITAPGMPTMTTKVWMEGNKMRAEMTEEGEPVIMLIDYDEGVAYMYMPEQNIAMQVPLSQAPESAIEEAQSITDYDYTVIGTDTRDGKVCTVVEYSYSGVSTKVWVWKEHGFPIRVEATKAGDTTIIEYKNIDFGDIPDSMFELPEGVEIIEF